jgi:hypothetical protein
VPRMPMNEQSRRKEAADCTVLKKTAWLLQKKMTGHVFFCRVVFSHSSRRIK